MTLPNQGTSRVLAVFSVIALVISLPFVILHLLAAPDDAH